jgi:OTU domain-containing protein 3
MTKRNVKVVQPGLVYVIEWDAGGDLSPERSASPDPTPASPASQAAGSTDEKPLTRRERKRLERANAVVQPPLPAPTEGATQPTVYVAYASLPHAGCIHLLTLRPVDTMTGSISRRSGI